MSESVVTSGQVESGAVIGNGVSQFVLSGGLTVSNTINSGGEQYI